MQNAWRELSDTDGRQGTTAVGGFGFTRSGDKGETFILHCTFCDSICVVRKVVNSEERGWVIGGVIN